MSPISVDWFWWFAWWKLGWKIILCNFAFNANPNTQEPNKNYSSGWNNLSFDSNFDSFSTKTFAKPFYLIRSILRIIFSSVDLKSSIKNPEKSKTQTFRIFMKSKNKNMISNEKKLYELMIKYILNVNFSTEQVVHLLLT